MEIGQAVDKNIPFFLEFVMFVAFVSFWKFVICYLFLHSK